MEKNEKTEKENKFEKIYNTSLPDGYRFTNFRFGDENNWAYIQYSAGVFKDYQKAIRKIFEEESALKKDFKNRCIFLEDAEGVRVGTLMLIPSNKEEGLQDIKYLAIIPKYKEKGLENILIAKANKMINDIKGATKINTGEYNEKSLVNFDKLGFER